MLMPRIRNIFSSLPAPCGKENFHTLKNGRDFKIERIVSFGHATPKNKWLCQNSAEWVMVLKGCGSLLFKGSGKRLRLRAGDYIFIPANTYHRVERTDPMRKTVWLAVHLKQSQNR